MKTWIYTRNNDVKTSYVIKGFKKRVGKKVANTNTKNVWPGPGISKHLLSLKVGDIVHDCDGFNHKISKIQLHLIEFTKGKIAGDITIEFDDGTWFCGCSTCCVAPVTPEEINEYFKGYYQDEALKKGGWHDDDGSKKLIALIKEGKSVCDKNGFHLP